MAGAFGVVRLKAKKALNVGKRLKTMIVDKSQIIKKLGKRKAQEFMMRNVSRDPTGFDKYRGIKGRVRFRICEHGNFLIKDYVPGRCDLCSGMKPTKLKEFKPYFNLGLGAFVESRQDEKRCAKALNLVEAG